MQGDVIGIVDSNGNTVATYSYDAWGAITSSSGTMAEINPIRYKGYYYDSDTGMYYLQSRYYDPSLRRFINADDPSLIESLTQTSVLGGNIFAYCGNNCVIGYDPTGYWATKDHEKMVIDSKANKLTKTQKKKIASYDTLCDKDYASTDSVSYPFHSRTAGTLTKALKTVYNFAVTIKKKNKKKKFKYNELFSQNFSCKDKLNSDSITTKRAKNANNKLLNKINSAKDANEQSYILMGFCMHMLQDFYAHQVRVILYRYAIFKGWVSVRKTSFAMTETNSVVGASKPNCEDNKNVLPWRFVFAQDLTEAVLTAYSKGRTAKSFNFVSDGRTTNMYSGIYYFNCTYKFVSYYQRISISTV